jgi:NAD-dependent deacetylase
LLFPRFAASRYPFVFFVSSILSGKKGHSDLERRMDISTVLKQPIGETRILVLTGAGISVASGIAPFRGDGGLYEGLNPYELATPEAFAKHPVTVWNWYLMRIHQGKAARPNAAHLALAELESIAKEVVLVTSNVDELHEQSGSSRVFHLHGRITQQKCSSCGSIQPLNLFELPERVDESTLFRCQCNGLLRPNVVWFGEYPWRDAVDAASDGIENCDAVLEVGSSGVVSYGFSEMAARRGKFVLRINPDVEESHGIHAWREKAEVALPQFISWLRD